MGIKEKELRISPRESLLAWEESHFKDLLDAVMYLEVKGGGCGKFWEKLPVVLWEADRLSIFQNFKTISNEYLPKVLTPKDVGIFRAASLVYRYNTDCLFERLSAAEMECLDRAYLNFVDGKIEFRPEIKALDILRSEPLAQDYFDEFMENFWIKKNLTIPF
jgi:hypothetical protein